MPSGFKLGDSLWLRLQFVIPFQHGPLNVLVKRVQIWRIWWPLVFSMISGQFACSHSCVTRAVLMENEPSWHQLVSVLDELRKQSTKVILSVNFRLLVDELEPTRSRYHNVFRKLLSLSTSRRLGLTSACFPLDHNMLVTNSNFS